MKNEIRINDNPLSFGESEEAYQKLLDSIQATHTQGQAQALRAINDIILETNWNNGRHIVEYEQGGKSRARYGSKLIARLSRDLTLRLGKGFSRSNLQNMRAFYLRFPIRQKVSGKLTWSHYVELVGINDDLEMSFYYHQAIEENWGIRELKRQKDAALFLILAASKDKKGVLKLAEKGRVIEKPSDAVKDIYVLEFLKISETSRYSESDLQKRILENITPFLLELGKGFTYVGKKYRIPVGSDIYEADLVFYHRILRCFVLIDLKVKEVKHYDIGQMNMYLGYFANEVNEESDNPPIGIILTRDKNDLVVEYATYEMNSQMFVSKYQLYLPDKDELRKLIDENISISSSGCKNGE